MRLFIVGLFSTLTIMQASFAQTAGEAEAARVFNEMAEKYPNCGVKLPVSISEPIVRDVPYKLVEEYWDAQTEVMIEKWGTTTQNLNRELVDKAMRRTKAIALTESYLEKNACLQDRVDFSKCLINVIHATTAAYCNFVAVWGLPNLD